jgi:hypothetical protein
MRAVFLSHENAMNVFAVMWISISPLGFGVLGPHCPFFSPDRPLPPPIDGDHHANPLTRAQRIWSEWQKGCLKKCDDSVRAYWVCREESGLLAPFKCGAVNDAMKTCLAECGRDEAGFLAFRERRTAEIIAETVAHAPAGSQ